MVQPNAENATLEELRVAMDAAPNKRSYIRLAAMRMLLMGIARETVCQSFCRTDRMVGYRTTIRWLHELDFHLRVPRPWPEGQDEQKRKAFLEQLHLLAEDPKVTLWLPRCFSFTWIRWLKRCQP